MPVKERFNRAVKLSKQQTILNQFYKTLIKNKVKPKPE